jgi:hypothetical protein
MLSFRDELLSWIPYFLLFLKEFYNFFNFFAGYTVFWSFRPFMVLMDAWIRTQSATVVSGCAVNLGRPSTHPSLLYQRIVTHPFWNFVVNKNIPALPENGGGGHICSILPPRGQRQLTVTSVPARASGSHFRPSAQVHRPKSALALCEYADMFT